jgi:hypothetical protein
MNMAVASYATATSDVVTTGKSISVPATWFT